MTYKLEINKLNNLSLPVLDVAGKLLMNTRDFDEFFNQLTVKKC